MVETLPGAVDRGPVLQRLYSAPVACRNERDGRDVHTVLMPIPGIYIRLRRLSPAECTQARNVEKASGRLAAYRHLHMLAACNEAGESLYSHDHQGADIDDVIVERVGLWLSAHYHI